MESVYLNLKRPTAHLRRLAGLSLPRAAVLLGLSSASGVHASERRETENGLPSLRTILARADAFGLDLRIVVRGRWVLRCDEPSDLPHYVYDLEPTSLCTAARRAKHFWTQREAEEHAPGPGYVAVRVRRVSSRLSGAGR